MYTITGGIKIESRKEIPDKLKNVLDKNKIFGNFGIREPTKEEMVLDNKLPTSIEEERKIKQKVSNKQNSLTEDELKGKNISELRDIAKSIDPSIKDNKKSDLINKILKALRLIK